MKQEDYVQSLELIGVTARIRRLNDRLMSSGRKVYDILRLDIEPNWHLVLLLLEEKGELSVTEIAAELKFSHPAVIKITGKMIEKGYLLGRRDRKDHRRQLLSLSPAAREKLPLFREQWDLIGHVHREYFSDAFISELTRIEQMMEAKAIEERVRRKIQGEIEFRKATDKDIPGIQAVARIAWPDTFGGMMPGAQISYMVDMQYRSEFLQEQMEARGHQYILVLQDGELVGYASYELNHGSPAEIMIHKAYLLPGSQGLGLGLALFDHLAKRGLKKGQETMKLNVFHKNNHALRFYEKYGFRITGREEKDIGGGFSVLDYVMRMPLKKTSHKK